MIELTDEMRKAFLAAMTERSNELAAVDAPLGGHDLIGVGLAAVFAIVERDYEVRPPHPNQCLCGADLGPPWDSVPHTRGSRGCRSAS